MSNSAAVLITEDDVKKVANLARLTLDTKDIPKHTQNLADILGMITDISKRDTENITPMASPFADTKLYLREDEATEPNVRDIVQKIAPATDSGLYLVPKVID